MAIVSRSISIPTDLHRILDFVHSCPVNSFHMVDLPYRLCSPAAQNPENGHIWENEYGKLVGFVMLQLPFATLDWLVQPANSDCAGEMIPWAVDRLGAIASQREDDLYFLLDSHLVSDPLALKYGFELDDWSMRRMCLRLNHPLDPPHTPQGFTIRPLKGLSESVAYVAMHRAAFGTLNMTEDWRARIIEHPAYQPNLDLVAENEKGQLVGFCIGWMGEIGGIKTGQIEPLGVLPDFQDRGLGRALLLENLRRMRKCGAINILIDAESYNPSSQHLYESVGFRDSYHTMKYFRVF